jgi:hypothetical protein
MMRFPQVPTFTFFAEIKFSVGTMRHAVVKRGRHTNDLAFLLMHGQVVTYAAIRADGVSLCGSDGSRPMCRPGACRERQLLWLAYVEGASHKEIADCTGLKAGSVRLLLFRARRRLAGLIGGSPRDSGSEVDRWDFQSENVVINQPTILVVLHRRDRQSAAFR